MRKNFMVLAAKLIVVLVVVMTSISLPNQALGSFVLPPAIHDYLGKAQKANQFLDKINKAVEKIQKLQDKFNKATEQYETMAKNIAAPVVYVWDKSLETVQNIENMANSLKKYQEKFENFDEYLNQFKGANFYRDAPCYNSNKECVKEEWEKTKKMQRTVADSAHNAFKDLMKTLDMLGEDNSEENKGSRSLADKPQNQQDSAEKADGANKAWVAVAQFVEENTGQLRKIMTIISKAFIHEAVNIGAELGKDGMNAVQAEIFNNFNYEDSSLVAW